MKLVSVSSEVHVTLWPSPNAESTYTPHTTTEQPIKQISLSKNGDWMVFVPQFGAAEIVSLVEEPKLLSSLQNFKNATCAAFQNSTKRYITLGTNSGQLLLYDIKTKAVKKKFPTSPSPFFKLEYNKNDSHIVGGCESGEIFVYNASTALKTNCFKVPKSKTLTNFACHNEKKNLISGCSEEGVVSVWDGNTGKTLSSASLHKAPVWDLSFRNDVVVSVGLDRRVCFFDYADCSLRSEVNLQSTPSSVDMSVDGVNLVVGFHDGNILGYDVRYMKEFWQSHSTHAGAVNRVAFFNYTQNSKPDPQVIPEEFVKDANSYETNGNDDNKGSFSQIYGNLAFISNNSEVLEQDQEQHNSQPGVQSYAADSFMDAMGYSRTKLTPTLINEVDGNERRDQESPKVLTPHNTNNYNKRNSDLIKQVLRRDSEGVKKSSTPILNLGESPSYYPSDGMEPSPIVADQNKAAASTQQKLMDPKVLKSLVRETVREELDEFKKEMKEYFADVITTTRRLVMDLQMSICIESLKTEENLEKLRREMFETDGQF